ncbi:hypothetical protein BDAP_000763 [Binucleata daphniae]
MSDLWQAYKNKIETLYIKQIEETYNKKLDEIKICKIFYKTYENTKIYNTKKKSRTKLHGYLTDEEIKNDLNLIKNNDVLAKLCRNKKIKVEMYGEVFYGKVKNIDNEKIIMEERNGNKMKISVNSVKSKKVKISIL